MPTKPYTGRRTAAATRSSTPPGHRISYTRTRAYSRDCVFTRILGEYAALDRRPLYLRAVRSRSDFPPHCGRHSSELRLWRANANGGRRSRRSAAGGIFLRTGTASICLSEKLKSCYGVSMSLHRLPTDLRARSLFGLSTEPKILGKDRI
jgi:hypothetical protein